MGPRHSDFRNSSDANLSVPDKQPQPRALFAWAFCENSRRGHEQRNQTGAGFMSRDGHRHGVRDDDLGGRIDVGDVGVSRRRDRRVDVLTFGHVLARVGEYP